MDRNQFKELFRKLNAVEAEWALDILGSHEELTLTLDELQDVGDCLCKINDHAEISETLLIETELAEAALIEQIKLLREPIISPSETKLSK